ncbi:MAG: tRNA pseudouridine(55) synthase TruB [Phycisphaerales bacterium]
MSENPPHARGDGTPENPTPCGLLLIDKQPGFTSMDVCAIIRGRLRKGGAPKRIKVGHGGTLDPMATGLLVVLVGKATRLCNQIMIGEKTYDATIDFSASSSTDDAEGEITRHMGVRTIDEPTFIATIEKFQGTILQRPPAFSAMRIGGRRAHEMARAGEMVVLAERPVFVRSIRVLEFAWPSVRVEVVCGKGTYIRSLARDIGASLAKKVATVGGMLTALRRTRSGEFDVAAARMIDLVPSPLTQVDLEPPPAAEASESTVDMT